MKNKIISWAIFFLLSVILSGCYDIQPIVNPIIFPTTTLTVTKPTSIPTSTSIPTPTTPSLEEEMNEWIDKTVVNVNTRFNLISSFSELLEEVVESPVSVIFPDTYDRFDEILSSLILESQLIKDIKCPDDDIQSNNEEIYSDTLLFKENFLISLKTWDQNAMNEALGQMKNIVDLINDTNQLLSQRYNK